MTKLDKKSSYLMSSPVGLIKISGDESGISKLEFDADQPENNPGEIPDVIEVCVLQLQEYFQGERQTFNLVLNPQGTDFQKEVWQELIKIPFGKTISYLELSKRLGNPKVIRAAANANGKNPLPILIPCHRVIGSDGSLTGYSGGLERKKWLLTHEDARSQLSLFS